MKIVNGERAGIPGSEQTVLGWLRKATGPYRLDGIAISGCFVPDQRGNQAEADLVLITPRLCAAIEVKGIRQAVSGTLLCPANGRWTMPGVCDEPVHVRGGDLNPLEQARACTLNLKNLAVKSGITDTFVPGLVLVLPQHRQNVNLGPKSLPRGMDVRIGSMKEFRAWFRANERRKSPWTAQQALALIRELHFDSEITLADLVAEGFESHEPFAVPSGSASQPDSARTEAAEPRPVPLGRTTLPAYTTRAATTSAVRRTARASRPTPPVVPPRSTAPARKPARRVAPKVFGAAVALALLTGGWWVFGQGADRADPRETTTTGEITQSITDAPAPTPTAGAEQPPAAPPAPSPTRNCYPFNC
ncbi:nuclease-related domain-containing protein [Nocardia sp. NPDC057668]|uniref:nuclease-related domain-containing protein n=1 Tax=Nocardia sp. NPDC057668 TaxID=3346202 RepID=UPI003672C66A